MHALALKNRGCPDIFHSIEHAIFNIQDFWATSACSEKQSCPKIFCCMEYTFHILNFWTTCACPEKQRVPWIHYIECIFYYYSGLLCNVRLPWKTEGALKFFAVLNIFFIILEFWVTCACPENRVTLEFFTVLNILFTFRIFEQLALALKNRVALEFFTVLKYILWFRIFEQLACGCPENRVCPENFQARGSAAPPTRTPMFLVNGAIDLIAR